jgi:hypothetical protein
MNLQNPSKNSKCEESFVPFVCLKAENNLIILFKFLTFRLPLISTS